jgi:hypothetical protein
MAPIGCSPDRMIDHQAAPGLNDAMVRLMYAVDSG